MAKDRPPEADDIFQGAFDLLILRTLIPGPAHGHTIAHFIERASENALEVGQYSLYPALHRLKGRGLVSSEWGVSDNSRVLYSLTQEGRKELEAATSRWWQRTRAIGLILGEPTAKQEQHV